MLYALESLLVPVLREALPDTVEVLAGPSLGPPAKGHERVEIVAADLEVTADAADPFAPRGPASLTTVHRWSADGVTFDFTLPSAVSGELIEVESPPGRPVRRGQDYALEGTTLRFYRAPSPALTAVVATLRTGPAAGYQERRPCTTQVGLAAWGVDLSRTDQLLDQALASVLARCVDLETLCAQHLGTGGVRMRLLKPTLWLERIERAQVKTGARWIPHAIARLRLHAELELTVAGGALEPELQIEQIRYHASVSRPK